MGFFHLGLRTFLFVIGSVTLVAACSDDDPKDSGNNANNSAALTEACDKYAAVDAKCNYDKLDNCKESLAPCTNAELAKISVFYDCLMECTPDGAGGAGGSSGTTIEDIGGACMVKAFGTSNFECAANASSPETDSE